MRRGSGNAGVGRLEARCVVYKTKGEHSEKKNTSGRKQLLTDSVLQKHSIGLVQAVRQPTILRDVVQVVNVDFRRVAHRDVAAMGEAPESKLVLRVTVVIMHAVRQTHVRRRVVRHLRNGHPAFVICVANSNHGVRNCARMSGMPWDGWIEMQRLRHEDGAGPGMVNIHGCVDCKRA